MDTLERISQDLSQQSLRKEASWRHLTITALEGKYQDQDTAIAEIIDEILKLTRPLILGVTMDRFTEDLRELLELAFETWKPARKNSAKIFATMDITVDGGTFWGSTVEQDDFSLFGDAVVDTESETRVLCLFPRIIRGDLEKPHIYFHGNALYSDSDAYIYGKSQEEQFKKLLEEAAAQSSAAIRVDPSRSTSRRARRNSDVPRSSRPTGHRRDWSIAPSTPTTGPAPSPESPPRGPKQ
jgi:hypothetical protein